MLTTECFLINFQDQIVAITYNIYNIIKLYILKMTWQIFSKKPVLIRKSYDQINIFSGMPVH